MSRASKAKTITLRLWGPPEHAKVACCFETYKLAELIDHACDCHDVPAESLWVEDMTSK